MSDTMKRLSILLALMLVPLTVHAGNSTAPVPFCWDQAIPDADDLAGWRLYIAEESGDPGDWVIEIPYEGVGTPGEVLDICDTVGIEGPEGTSKMLYFQISAFDEAGNDSGVCDGGEISAEITFPDTTPPACPLGLRFGG